MTRDKIQEQVHFAIYDTALKGLPATAELIIMQAIDAYRDAEIQRVCEVTPEMYSKVRQELGYYDNFKMAEIASGLTTALRERAKGE